jgi:hypothetical protein
VPTELAPLPFSRFDELARRLAALDVELGEQPRHRIAGFAGEEPLALLDLRPFPPGGVHEPMVEAVAGLLALGADHLAAALPGRAWSVADPVVPVSDAGDLRQRVLLLTTARPHAGPRTWLRPFDLHGTQLTWQDAVAEDDACEGWVPHALQVAVDAAWPADPVAAAEQLARCSRLGHHVLLGPAGAAVLDGLSRPGGSA